MAEPFIIHTNLDLTGIKDGFKQLRVLLAQQQKMIASGSLGGGDTSGTKAATKANMLHAVSMQNVLGNLKKIKQKQGDVNDELGKGSKRIRNFDAGLSDVGRRVFIWGSLSAAIFGTLAALKAAVDFTIEFNVAMAELKKVIPKESDFKALQNTSFELAIEFGVEPLEAVKTMRRFAQAGLSTKEAVEASRTALLAMNVAMVDFESAMGAIVAANKIFGFSFAETARIMDKIQAVQAQFAVDPKDLIQSITAIGPAIKALGGDIDDLMGNIAALAEAARISGKEASNSLKRVFSRIPSAEGIQALQEVGIAVFSLEGKFRPLNAIMQDIAKTMDKATEAEKVNLAITLAQVRQYPKLLALIDNYNQAVKATAISAGALTEAQDANRITMASYDKRLVAAGARMTQFGNEFVESGVIQTLVLFKETAGMIATSLLPLIKGIAMIVSGTAVVATTFKLARTIMIGWGKDTKEVFKGIGTHLVYFNRGAGKAALASDKVRISMMGWRKAAACATFLMGALTLLAPIIFMVMESIQKNSKAIKEMTKDVENFKKSLSGLNKIGFDVENTDTQFRKIQSAIIGVTKSMNGLNEISDKAMSIFFTEITGKPLDQLGGEELAQTNKLLKEFQSLYLTILNRPVKEAITGQIKRINKAFDGMIKKAADIGKTEGVAKEIAQLRKFSWMDLISDRGHANANYEAITKIYETVDSLAILEKQWKLTSDTTRKGIIKQQMSAEIDEAAKSILKYIDVQELLDDPKKQIAGTETNIGAIIAETEAEKHLLQIKERAIEFLNEYATKVQMTGIELKKFKAAFSEIFEEIKPVTEAIKHFTIAVNAVSILGGVKKSLSSTVAGFNAQFIAIDKVSVALKNSSIAYNMYVEKATAADNAIKETIRKTKENVTAIKTVENEIAALNSMIKVAREAASTGDKITVGIKDKSLKDNNAKLSTLKQRLISLKVVAEENDKRLGDVIKRLGAYAAAYQNIVSWQKRQVDVAKTSNRAFSELAKQTISFNNAFSNTPIEKFKTNEKVYAAIVEKQKEGIDAQRGALKLSDLEIKYKKQDLDDAYKIEKSMRARIVVMQELKRVRETLISFAEKQVVAEHDIQKSIIDANLELSKVGKQRDTDNIFKLELKAIKAKTALEKDSIKTLLDRGIITEQEANTQMVMVGINERKLAAEVAINDILERRTIKYNKIKTEVDGIKSSVTTWLTDQNQLLDDLAGTNGIATAIGRLATGITDVMNQRDAEIISDALTGRIEKTVNKMRGGVIDGFEYGSKEMAELISKVLDDTTFPANIAKSLTSAQEAISLIQTRDLENAWEKIAKEQFPELTKAIIAGFEGGLSKIGARPSEPTESIDEIMTDFSPISKRIFSEHLEIAKLIAEKNKEEKESGNKIPDITCSTDCNLSPIIVEKNTTDEPLVPAIGALSNQVNELSKMVISTNKPVVDTIVDKETTDKYSGLVMNNLLDTLSEFQDVPIIADSQVVDVVVDKETTDEPLVPAIGVLSNQVNELSKMILTIDTQHVDTNIEKDIPSVPLIINIDNLLSKLSGLSNMEEKINTPIIGNDIKKEETRKHNEKVLKETGVQIVLAEESNIIQGKNNDVLNKISAKIDTGNGINANAATDSNAAAADAKGALKRMAVSLAVGAVGREVAKSNGRDSSLVNAGSSVGGLTALALGATPGGLVAGAAMLAGGVLGGLLGGKKEEEKQQIVHLEKIAQNTSAMVDQLSPQLFNAPSTFSLPAMGFSTTQQSVTNNYNITIDGNADGEDIVDAIQTMSDTSSILD